YLSVLRELRIVKREVPITEDNLINQEKVFIYLMISSSAFGLDMFYLI
ncbi:unnamed protein product, partial [marine sediment metagenome]